MTTQDCCTRLSLKTLSNFLPSTPPQVSIIDFLSRIMFALIFDMLKGFHGMFQLNRGGSRPALWQ